MGPRCLFGGEFVKELRAWLDEIGLGKYADILLENEVDFDVLPELGEADLEKLGFPLGPRKRLLRAIATLTRNEAEHAAAEENAAGGDGIEAAPERRQLTVMFCDLVGSTALSKELDPEDLSNVIRNFQGTCRKVIAEFGGTVARYMGDGVLVYFGYPRASEHDAERAILAGLGIVDAVSRIENRGVHLQTRIGIATGLVVVGEVIGEGFAREQAVVGETPNLAARMQSLAEPDSVVIADETRRLAAGLFDYVDLGRRELKGFPEPMQAWQVRHERTIESRFDALHGEHALAPLIGREEEVEVLVRRWQQARAGSGQVVVLTGEAGLGKSRLAQSLRDQIGDEPHTMLRYFCAPYYQNSALYPFITQLERAARLAREDSPQTRLEKLEALLARAGQPATHSVPLLASLLGIPTGERYPAIELSPPQRKEHTLAALEEQLAGLARQRPVFALFEDLHWIDPTSLELLGRTVDDIATMPVLLLLTARPDFSVPWIGAPQVTSIALKRLAHGDGAALVQTLTGGKALPREVLEQIVAKTDGVPLFVEELTKTLLESGVLAEHDDRYTLRGPLPAMAVPSTLQDSLMARLDRLGTAKEIAQVGAVLGRSFSHELMTAVTPTPEGALQAGLQQLCAADLLQVRGTPPEATYTFKHALVQDAAYNSLLRTRRQTLHAHIARVLEARFADTVANQPERLAQHFTGAGLGEQAVGYWLRAGQNALQRSAYLEAVGHFTQGVELVQLTTASRERNEIELNLRSGLGVALIATRGYAADEVHRNYARAGELCEETGETPQLIPALYGKWVYHLLRGDRDDCFDIADLLHRFADDPEQPLVTASARAISHFYQGDLPLADGLLEDCMRRYDPAQHKTLAAVYGDDAALLPHFYHFWCSWLRGFADSARRQQAEAQALAERYATPYILAVALLFEMILQHELRDVPATRATALRLKELSEENGYPFFVALGSIGHGTARVLQGDTDGIAELEGGIAGFRATGARLPVPYYLHLLVEARLHTGDIEQGLETVEEAITLTRAQVDRFYEAELCRQKGELLAASGKPDEAEANLREAMSIARTQGASVFELRAAASLARLLAGGKRGDDARAALAEVHGRFREGHDSADLIEARDLLDSLTAS